jgi:threonine aldolase
VPERDGQEIMWRCERWLGGRRPVTVAAQLTTAAAAVPADARPDRYGDGAIVQAFEADLAERLGKPAAVLMPSGTMAQQIALRIHCEARGRDTIAFHPTCHLALHEHGAHQHLHGLKAELVGHRDRLIELADLQALHASLGALLLELPQREIGGQLPEWDALQAQIGWARERGVAIHLDGARLWECTPYYGRTPLELAEPFDTVYVSLYKALGGLAGCVLAGPEDLVAQARVWRRRHGGTLPTLAPLVASTLPGLSTVPAHMPDYLAHARSLAAALGPVEGIDVVPDPPQTPLMHLHLRGERETLVERALALAQETGVWLFGTLAPTARPGVHRLEVSVGEPALEISAEEAAELLARVVR